MPINHQHKLLFIHIPRTGGTSIEASLGMHGNLHDIGLKPYLNQKRNWQTFFGGGLQHLGIQELGFTLKSLSFKNYSKNERLKRLLDKCLSSLSVLNPIDNKENHILDDYLKFSVVRNPYDRFLSAYCWKYHAWEKNQEVKMNHLLNFVEILDKSPNELQKKIHFKPQYDFVFDSRKILKVDRILRFENLEEEFMDLCKEINLEAYLPHLMKSNSIQIGDFKTNPVKEIIYQAYQKDFEVFEYEK